MLWRCFSNLLMAKLYLRPIEFLEDDFQVKNSNPGHFVQTFGGSLHLFMQDKCGKCWIFLWSFEQASTHYLAGKGILEFGVPGDKARHGTEGCNSRGALKSTSSLVFLADVGSIPMKLFAHPSKKEDRHDEPWQVLQDQWSPWSLGMKQTY